VSLSFFYDTVFFFSLDISAAAASSGRTLAFRVNVRLPRCMDRSPFSKNPISVTSSPHCTSPFVFFYIIFSSIKFRSRRSLLALLQILYFFPRLLNLGCPFRFFQQTACLGFPQRQTDSAAAPPLPARLSPLPDYPAGLLFSLGLPSNSQAPRSAPLLLTVFPSSPSREVFAVSWPAAIFHN